MINYSRDPHPSQIKTEPLTSDEVSCLRDLYEYLRDDSNFISDVRRQSLSSKLSLVVTALKKQSGGLDPSSNNYLLHHLLENVSKLEEYRLKVIFLIGSAISIHSRDEDERMKSEGFVRVANNKAGE